MKKEYTFHFIVGLFIVFSYVKVYANSISSQQASIDINDVLEQIDKKGADRVLKSLYSKDDVWQLVLMRIANADRKWIKLAVLLKPHSDAGVSSMLNGAVGEALVKSPEAVFQITNNVFELTKICDCPDTDNYSYSTYDRAVAAVELRIKSLEKMDTKQFEKERDFCINKLEESIPHLKRFFEVK